MVQTDHKALQSLMSSNHLNRRLWRWALFLQDFAVSFIYRPGVGNQVADGLSRQAWLEEAEEVPALLPGVSETTPSSRRGVYPLQGGQSQQSLDVMVAYSPGLHKTEELSDSLQDAGRGYIPFPRQVRQTIEDGVPPF